VLKETQLLVQRRAIAVLDYLRRTCGWGFSGSRYRSRHGDFFVHCWIFRRPPRCRTGVRPETDCRRSLSLIWHLVR